MNNQNISLIGLFLICLFLLSCDKEVACSNATSQLTFIAFPDSEIDTFILKRFTKATNFTTFIDSFSINHSNSTYSKRNDTLVVNNSLGGDYGLKSKYDYEIYVPQTNRYFKIRDIDEPQLQQKVSVFLFTKPSGCLNQIKSYNLNGLLISGNNDYYSIYIRK